MELNSETNETEKNIIFCINSTAYYYINALF